MKTTRKLLLLIAVVAIVVATLAVAASAYVNTPYSLYADINGSESWVQIAGGSAKDSNTDGDYEDEGDLYSSSGNYRAYYNATTKTVSVEGWQDGLEMAAYSSSNTAASHFTYWMINNAASIEHIQIRNLGRITNGYYLFGMLTNLKTMTIGDTCTEWTATDSSSAHFKGLTALETIKWGTWNKTTGAFTASYGEDGVWDLRGFKYMKPSATIYQNSTDIAMLFGSSVRSSGAKKIVLPYTQTLLSDEYTINKVVISDGSEAFVEGNSKQGESSYGTAFAAGTLVYVIQDASGNQYYSKNNWSFESGWSKVTELAKDRAPYYGVYTGIIPYAFAHSATALAEVVVPQDSELKHIEAYAFYNCTALKLLDVQGTVADDFAITNKNAFTNVTDLVIRVYDETSKTNMENALTAAGVTCATVELSTDDSGEEETATMPEGVTNTSDKWIDSGYTDVDTEEGWYLIGKPEKDTSATATTYPTFAFLENGRFYWNKLTDEAVWLVTGTVISANWGEENTNETTKRNLLVDGGYFTMKWIFKQLEEVEGHVFESLEFRRAVDNTATTFTTAGMVTEDIEVKKVLFDSNITSISFQTGDRGLFRYVSNIRTLAHVTYKADMSGDYTGTVTDGVVDVSGFTKVKSWNATSSWNSTLKQDYYTNRIFRDSGMTEVIWFDTLVNTADSSLDHAGVLDDLAFYNCSNLTKLTMTAPLTYIGDRTFGNCKKLTVIDLKGGVAVGAVVNASTDVSYARSFAGATQAITVYVYSNLDYNRAVALFSPWSNITVVNQNTSATDNAITSDGYSIRITDEDAKTAGPALRAEFTLLKSMVDEASSEGYTLSDYGIIVFSANTLAKYNSDERTIFKAAHAGSSSAIIKKTAENGPYVRVNDSGDITFAAALTGISADNYTSEVYTYAYAEWTKDGETTYTYTTYVSERTGKDAHSLYDATVYAFRIGYVNSQNFAISTGVKLWDILQKGAFSITEGEENTYSDLLEPTIAYKFVDDSGAEVEEGGTFTYLDLPLYAWRFGMLKADGEPNWNSTAHSLEETSSTNVVWSILVDSDELVVVYRRSPDAADDAVATLPWIEDRSAGGYAPYSSAYFNPSDSITLIETAYDKTVNGFYKYPTIYSPILTETNANKITALVIDYGVDKFSPSALENTTVKTLETIVYPEGMTAGKSILRYNYYVKNIIYASESKTSLTSATQASDFGAIADLSGLASVGFNYIFSNAQNIENVILPATTTGLTSVEEFMNTATDIKRIWTVGNEVPESGVLDLSKTGLVAVTKNSFTGVGNITKIIMPSTFKGVTSYSYRLSEVGPCSQTFGADMTFTIDLGDNYTALAEVTGTSYYGLVNFYDQLQTAKTAGTLATQSAATIVYPTDAQADNLDHINVTCSIDGETMTKTIPEWSAYIAALEEEANTPRVLPFTAGLNVNGMETFLSDNEWGIFETGIKNVTNADTYSNIKSKGFDYVRIPVNFYTIYYEATKHNYTTEQLMGYLDTGIEYALANDLYVMIDFHGWFYIGEEENDYEEFLYCWTQVANRYKDYSEKVIFELLNEPWYTDGKAQTYLSDSRLNTMQAEAVEIIRGTGSNNATRLIVLCTADGNKAWKLSSLVLPDDDNLAVAIHEYSPYNFTHQGFEWAGLSGTTTTLEAEGGFTSATGYDFSQITKFIEANPKVPIILNEFGVNLVKATEADIETYLTGITSFCTENNIPWAYWQYYGDYSTDGSMSLYRKSSYYGSFAWDETALGFLFASASAS